MSIDSKNQERELIKESFARSKRKKNRKDRINDGVIEIVKRAALLNDDFKLIDYNIKKKLLPKAMQIDLLNKELEQAVQELTNKFPRFKSVTSQLDRYEVIVKDKEFVKDVLCCLDDNDLEKYVECGADVSSWNAILKYIKEDAENELPCFDMVVQFIVLVYGYQLLKRNLEEGIIPTHKQTNLTGFKSTLKPHQIKSLFEQLKGEYVDEKTNIETFNALFKNEALTDNKINWIDKSITRPQKANLRTLHELFLLLIDNDYLNKEDAFSDMIGKIKINAIIGECFFDGIANVPFKNVHKGNETNKPTQKTERHRKLKVIISNL